MLKSEMTPQIEAEALPILRLSQREFQIRAKIMISGIEDN
jgi:hypothetical protein|tara:strand:+ start:20018 stop:20137 length:120 start_codon:yes stop_codon:yes gene_type:complete